MVRVNNVCEVNIGQWEGQILIPYLTMRMILFAEVLFCRALTRAYAKPIVTNRAEQLRHVKNVG